MAIVYAIKTGVWSDTTVWNTGALPTTADDVYSNNFTVTINISPTVLSISNLATTGVTAGGSFVPSNGITLTCTAATGLVAGGNLFVSTLTAGQSCSVVGNGLSGIANGPNKSCIYNNGAGTINVTGNYLANTSFGQYDNAAIWNNWIGTINITGNVTGGIGSVQGVNNQSSGTVNITGNVTGGITGVTSGGAENFSTGTLNVIGQVIATTTSPGIAVGSATQNTILTGPLITTQNGNASDGVNPCVALRWFVADNVIGTFTYPVCGQTAVGGVRPLRSLYLTDAYSSLYPSPANVRRTTSYGPSNIYTGTCAIPNAASVQQGVSVGNTTGTVAVGGSTIRAALGLSSANLDSQLSSINSTINQIPPAVRTELAPELARASNVATTSDIAQLVATAA